MMSYTQAKGRAQTKWENKVYYTTKVRFPKDAEDLIRKAADGNLNAYISNLVLKDCGYKKGDDDGKI